MFENRIKSLGSAHDIFLCYFCFHGFNQTCTNPGITLLVTVGVEIFIFVTVSIMLVTRLMKTSARSSRYTFQNSFRSNCLRYLKSVFKVEEIIDFRTLVRFLLEK